MKTQFLIRSLLVVGMVFASAAVLAHEGHDHDGPVSVKAPKGGMLKELDASHIEVVPKGKDFKIYFYDEEMKPVSAEDFTVTAVAELPRSKKKEELKLTVSDTVLEGTYDAHGSHRYTLILSVAHGKGGHSDQLKFTIEPKK